MVSLYLFLRSLPLPAAFSVLLGVLFSSFERLLPLSSASYLITSHQTVCNCDSSVFGWLILAHSAAYFTSKLHALPDPRTPTPFIPPLPRFFWCSDRERTGVAKCGYCTYFYLTPCCGTFCQHGTFCQQRDGDKPCSHSIFLIWISIERERERERERETETDRQTDRQRQNEKQTETEPQRQGQTKKIEQTRTG